MKMNDGRAYVFFRHFDTALGVVYQTLKAGAQSGDHPNAVLKAADFRSPCILGPDGSMVVTDDVALMVQAAAPDQQSSFKRYQKLEVYDINPRDYPQELDELVARDDFDQVIWKRVAAKRRAAQFTVLEYCPHILTYPEIASMPDMTKTNIQYSVASSLGIIAQEKEIDWSPSLVARFPCCWVDGGYFLSREVLGVLRPFLSQNMWEIVFI